MWARETITHRTAKAERINKSVRHRQRFIWRRFAMLPLTNWPAPRQLSFSRQRQRLFDRNTKWLERSAKVCEAEWRPLAVSERVKRDMLNKWLNLRPVRLRRLRREAIVRRNLRRKRWQRGGHSDKGSHRWTLKLFRVIRDRVIYVFARRTAIKFN